MCTLSPVFNKNDNEHDNFLPVLKWIVEGKGKIIYGGTSYKRELLKASKYIKLFRTLEQSGKVKVLNDTKVDLAEKAINVIVSKNSSCRNFNDQHIVAIVIISKCLLLCTRDLKHAKFFKYSKFYPKNIKRPSIYSRKANEDLLNDKYIANICTPAQQGSKALRNLFGMK